MNFGSRPRSVTTGGFVKDLYGDRIEVEFGRIHASAKPGVAYNYSMQIMEWRVDWNDTDISYGKRDTATNKLDIAEYICDLLPGLSYHVLCLVKSFWRFEDWYVAGLIFPQLSAAAAQKRKQCSWLSEVPERRDSVVIQSVPLLYLYIYNTYFQWLFIIN